MATLYALNATARATPNPTKDASRNASNATSGIINKWESFGALWKGQFDFYKYRGDNLTHVLTDDVQEVLTLLGPWKDAKLIQVKIFGSGIPDASSFLERLRMGLNPSAYGKAGADMALGAISAPSASVSSASGRRTRKSELTLEEEFKLRGKAIDNTWMHHDFVVLVCEMNGKKLFVSMEKMTHAIVIQTAEDEKPLREKIQNMPRENVFNNPFQVDDCKNNLR